MATGKEGLKPCLKGATPQALSIIKSAYSAQ